MFDAARERMAYRRALKWVRRRLAAPWHTDPAHRRVLFVVPEDPDEARAVWRFVEGFHLVPERTLPILLGPDIGSVSTPFLNRVRVVQPQDFDRLGLPNRALRTEVWSFRPEVALSLAPGFLHAGAALVGASPAAFRAGFFAPDAEPFFDLMASGEGGVEGGLHALGEALDRIEPAVLSRRGG